MRKRITLIASLILLAILGMSYSLRRQPSPDENQETNRGSGFQHTAVTNPSSRRSKPSASGGSSETYPLSSLRDKKHFTALAEKVFSIRDPEKRLQAIREHLGMNVPDGVYREALCKYGFRIEPMQLFEILMECWKATDPQAVMAWVKLLPPAVAGEHLATIGDPPLASFKPETSEDFIKLFTSDEKFNSDRMIREWVAKSPLEAANFLLEASNPEVRAMLDKAVGYWAATDPDSALEWAKGLEADFRTEAVIAALPAWCLKHPGESVDLSALPAVVDRQVMEALVEVWTFSDPASASAYALAIGDPEIMHTAIGKVAETWARMDANEAAAWADGLSDKDLRDIALEEVFRKIGKSDYAAARDVALKISDPETRSWAIFDVIGRGLAQGAPDAIQLAGEIQEVASWQANYWSKQITDVKCVPAFRQWFETARAQGLIKGSDLHSPEDNASNLDSVFLTLDQIEADTR